jgi:hypothetical protein
LTPDLREYIEDLVRLTLRRRVDSIQPFSACFVSGSTVDYTFSCMDPNKSNIVYFCSVSICEVTSYAVQQVATNYVQIYPAYSAVTAPYTVFRRDANTFVNFNVFIPFTLFKYLFQGSNQCLTAFAVNGFKITLG